MKPSPTYTVECPEHGRFVFWTVRGAEMERRYHVNVLGCKDVKVTRHPHKRTVKR